MKHIRLLVLVIVALGIWWFLSRKSPFIPSPSQVLKAEPSRIEETLSLKAGEAMRWTIAAPGGKVPGHLQGQWNSQGKSAGIKGATDDTLVSFKLVGPDNSTIQKLDHPSYGNFSLRVTSPGDYTFVFDNQGIIRSSARTIKITGTYQPD